MIEPAHGLPVSRQAELLDLSHSNVYYLPRPASESDLTLMRRIDELHLNYPFAGARMLRDMLKLEVELPRFRGRFPAWFSGGQAVPNALG